jgi:copper chaperone
MSEWTRQEFAVDGMNCQGCVRGVTGALTKVAGIRAVDVSLEDARASVEYDATLVDPAAIVTAIEAAGFEVRPR